MASVSLLGSLYTSARDRLQGGLDRAIADGRIKGADKGALSAALDAIDSDLSGGATGKKALSPSDLKDGLDKLIDDRVKSGSLTADQARELRSLFEARSGRGQEALKKLDSAFEAFRKDGTIPSTDADAVKSGLDRLRKVFAALAPSGDREDTAALYTAASKVLSKLVSDGKLSTAQAGQVLKTVSAAKTAQGDTGDGPDLEALSQLRPEDVGNAESDDSFNDLRLNPSLSDAALAEFVSSLVQDVQSMSFDYGGKGRNRAFNLPLLLDYKT